MDSVASLLPYLPQARLQSVRFFQTLASTNTYLKSLADAPNGTVIIAKAQTNGRGRYGKSFHSPSGKGIYMSYFLRGVSTELMQILTPMCAVAVKHAVEEIYGASTKDKIKIKWVNDLLLNGKKFCGILCEAVFDNGVPCAVIGVGVDVLQKSGDFPPDIADIATSLSAETGVDTPPEALAAAIITQLDRLVSENPEEFHAEYEKNCITLGKSCRMIMPNKTENVTVLSINRDFSLNVQHENGTISIVRAGEIQIKP